jgi:GAF domain-containing protein
MSPTDPSSQKPGGTFFSDTLPEGAPGIHVLTAALPEEAAGDDATREESADLNPQGVAILEKVEPAGKEQDHHQALVRFREILLDDGREASEKIQGLLELGAERLGVENGHLARIDADEGVHKSVQFGGASPPAELPITTDLSNTYCRMILANEHGMVVENAEGQGWASDPAYEKSGFSTYLGARVFTDGKLSGTVCFADSEARVESFNEEDTTFLTLLAEAIGRLLEKEEGGASDHGRF